MDSSTLASLNVDPAALRLQALTDIAARGYPAPGDDVNNHIHTAYSFSPYTPTAAVHFARQAGLATAGIMDHDSVAGAREFKQAGRIAGLKTTQGIEMRVNMQGTPFASLRLNNPDQPGCMYMALHGIPDAGLDEVQATFAPLREARNDRNRRMVSGINAMLAPYRIALDFESDVLPLSRYAEGGSVTERHVAMALANALVTAHGTGDRLLAFMTNELAVPISPKIKGYLADPANPNYAYDLLGLIKSDLIARFYVPADAEMLSLDDALALGERVHALTVYPYLGDVTNSVTGDKRAQTFEDSFLPELFDFIAAKGFRAVAYMPSRNTHEQLARVQALCRAHGFFQISGEDINTPRQSFVCEAQRRPEFAALTDAAWALIAHERLADVDPARGLFGSAAVREYPDLEARVRALAAWARENA